VPRSQGRNEIVALYSQFGSELWRALLVTAGGRGDLAEEAVAEAFSRYVVHHERVRDPQAWLYRTGYRVVVAELRREQPLRVLEEADRMQQVMVVSPGIVAAMARLTPRQRLTTFLAYQMDLPLVEVARLTGSSVPGVKMRLHRARRRLQELLKEDAGV
jgi:RNA polymerase sigma factor (sigma-70 family)